MAQHEPCPACGAPGARTIDSRPTPAGRVRRRICDRCGRRWSTVEVSVDAGRALRQAQRAVDAALADLDASRAALVAAKAALLPLVLPEDESEGS